MIVIDMDMPKNCSECYESHIIDCDLIFSGCANCGRHPNCPIKCDIEDIRAEQKALITTNSTADYSNGVMNCLNVIDNYKGDKA